MIRAWLLACFAGVGIVAIQGCGGDNDAPAKKSADKSGSSSSKFDLALSQDGCLSNCSIFV